MTPTSLTPSSDPRPLWIDSDDGSAPRAGDDRPPDPPRPPQPPRPTGRGRGGAPLAALLVASAMLGGAATTGILAATGQIGEHSTTTVIERPANTATAASTSSSAAGGLDAEALYAGASAGVVDITSRTGSSGGSASPFGGGAPQQSQGTATGTGFVVDRQGHVVTAAHVVDGATSVTAKLADGTTRKATVLGVDDATDIAVLQIDASGLTLHPLELGSSASLDVGAEVAAIGDPFGYERSISTGIVSGVDRTIAAPNGFTVAHAIQTDAAMNPGNSGGPVLDANGKVIGIADQIATNGSSEQSSGVGFAVPIDLVKSTLNTLASGGKVAHAFIGIQTGDSASPAGAAIGAVGSGGPAAHAGLRAGDVVTAFDGKPIADSNSLVAAIAGKQPGDKVELTVRRGSDTVHVTVTLGTQPAKTQSSGG